MDSKKVNFNTLLITLGFSLLGWGAHELYSEMRHIHDEVLVIKTDMVHRQEFDVQITDLRSRVSSIELQIQQIRKNNP